MRRLIVIPFIFITLSLFAAPIGEQKAREIALKFFGTSGTRTSSVVLEMEWAGSDIESVEKSGGVTRSSAVGSENDVEEALVYIYNRVDTKGFVVVAGDDKVKKPILAFSYDNTFDVENMPDGAKAILQAWCQQVAATRASNRLSAATRADDTSVGNVVCKYETALWDQGEPFRSESPVHNGTKTRIGCVSTAIAIMIRYHQWPECGVGTTPEYTYRPSMDRTSTITIETNKLGRKYDYSKMLLDYTKGYTEAEGAAVAALVYDVGTSVQAQFDTNNTTPLIDNYASSIVRYFRYTKNTRRVDGDGYAQSEWIEMVKANLLKNGPTIFRGQHTSGGHCFILDGYTDANYFSVNFGWSGSSNGYYLLPSLQYYLNQAAFFDLIPDRDDSSEYVDHLTLLYKETSNATYRGLYTLESKYMVGKSFVAPILVTNSGIADYYGQFCIAHCNKSGEIKEVLYTISRSSKKISPSGYAGYLPTIQINKTIESGDRLRVFSRSSSDAAWERVRANSTRAYSEVLLWATPQEVAKSLNITYEKESKIFTFTSEHAIQYSITNASGSVVKSGKAAPFNTTKIDLSELESGKYTFSFASGGEPYKLNIKL